MLNIRQALKHCNVQQLWLNAFPYNELHRQTCVRVQRDHTGQSVIFVQLTDTTDRYTLNSSAASTGSSLWHCVCVVCDRARWSGRRLVRSAWRTVCGLVSLSHRDKVLRLLRTGLTATPSPTSPSESTQS